jgi:hypothetical protein
VVPGHYHQREPGLPPAMARVSQVALAMAPREAETAAHAGVPAVLEVRT